MTDSPSPGADPAESPRAAGVFQELRRRKVIRAGLAYLVAAWLVIQVGVTIAPQLNMPDWVPRPVTLLALLGLPVVLVLAWLIDFGSDAVHFEPKSTGTKRVLTAAAILAALAVGWFVRGGLPSSGGADGAGLGSHSTAVLPFVNMSSDKDNDYFSDGLTENLLHKPVRQRRRRCAAQARSAGGPRRRVRRRPGQAARALAG